MKRERGASCCGNGSSVVMVFSGTVSRDIVALVVFVVLVVFAVFIIRVLLGIGLLGFLEGEPVGCRRLVSLPVVTASFSTSISMSAWCGKRKLSQQGIWI